VCLLSFFVVWGATATSIIHHRIIVHLPESSSVSQSQATMNGDDIKAAIEAKGNEIKDLKAAKPPTMKEDLKPLVADLLALKVSYKEVTGLDFDPPKAKKASNDDEEGETKSGDAEAGDGEKISKNALKKAEKNKLKAAKEKKEVAPKPAGEKKEKKPKKEKVEEVIPVDNTAVGDKKITDGEFPSAYHPLYVEAAWQSWWEKSGYYGADAADALGKSADEKFVIVIPPPNVTGSLHLGHALTSAIEDTIVRWNRMRGTE
jgi:hypothetical protein